MNDSRQEATYEEGSSSEARCAALVTHKSPSSAKIRLFRSLFRGREDVFPLRFESRRTGKKGYQPACANEWVRGICEKPRIKCSLCPNQQFFPVTDEAVRWHLTGIDEEGRDFVMGVYPMLKDETCLFLAVDFDRQSWQEDAGAFLRTCQRLGLVAGLERSRSGNGGHIWLFFAEAIPAKLARAVGSHLLTEAMEERSDLGFRSYDRFFPNQDTLPTGGFGNLIALPLQKKPRERGNCLFLDEEFVPYPDQWAFLSSVRRISAAEMEALARDAAKRGRILALRSVSSEEADSDAPWKAPPSRRRNEPSLNGPLPEKVELVLGDQIYIAKDGLLPGLRTRLLRLAAFPNPEFYRAQTMRFPTYDKPRIIDCTEETTKYIALPRGCAEVMRALLKSLKIDVVVRDERCTGRPLSVSFHGRLGSDQQAAADALLAHDTGVLAAATGFGKTVIGAWLIAKRGVNTLVLVHRRQLLDQWVERLSALLGLPAKSVGCLGGGRKKLTGALDVALIQSLVHQDAVDDRIAEYGHLVVDECHHLSAQSFERVARRAKARFVTGLSATVIRKDGHHPIIFMQCGPIRYRVTAKGHAAGHPFSHQVRVCPTGFWIPAAEVDPDCGFHRLYEAMVNDQARNDRIREDILAAVREGRCPLVLTERTAHLEHLQEQLASRVNNLVVLKGGLTRREWNRARNQLADSDSNASRVILATGRFIGEGFDDARLDTLFLTFPVSWRGTIAQYVGRLHRLHAGKREVRVYDYADLDVPMLARMFDRRCRGYEAAGYSIVLPASAVPGWPADVPLPSDSNWKRDYAGSVRRLIRDGVDSNLANLFSRVSPTIVPDAEGLQMARSASEAFLYRRLETLKETSGRFRLNVELPIPFDGRGKMEVDFLCEDAGLVIELDGAQHLADPDAYRRDRRKDALLQEHGYFVLRFLAEDLGKRLEVVLETIIHTLDQRLLRKAQQ